MGYRVTGPKFNREGKRAGSFIAFVATQEKADRLMAGKRGCECVEYPIEKMPKVVMPAIEQELAEQARRKAARDG